MGEVFAVAWAGYRVETAPGKVKRGGSGEYTDIYGGLDSINARLIRPSGVAASLEFDAMTILEYGKPLCSATTSNLSTMPKAKS